MLAEFPTYDRTSINSWEDAESRQAVEQTGRKKLIIYALGDRDLEKDLRGAENRNERQRTRLLTRIGQAASQTLAVPS